MKKELYKKQQRVKTLRTQLAESEAACAGYRAALENTLAALLQENDDAPCVFAARDAARQALQSNPGKAVGDVIAAARLALWALRHVAPKADATGKLDVALAKLEGSE